MKRRDVPCSRSSGATRPASSESSGRRPAATPTSDTSSSTTSFPTSLDYREHADVGVASSRSRGPKHRAPERRPRRPGGTGDSGCPGNRNTRENQGKHAPPAESDQRATLVSHTWLGGGLGGHRLPRERLPKRLREVCVPSRPGNRRSSRASSVKLPCPQATRQPCSLRLTNLGSCSPTRAAKTTPRPCSMRLPRVGNTGWFHPSWQGARRAAMGQRSHGVR